MDVETSDAFGHLGEHIDALARSLQFTSIDQVLDGLERPSFRLRQDRSTFETSSMMVWPGVIERAIQTIDSAPFLSREQKRDAPYDNAARVLRFSDAEVARHHGR